VTDGRRPPDRPVIRGRRVYLRPVEPDDAGIIQRWYEDAEFLALMGGRPASLAERRAALERRAVDPPRDVINLLICLRADGRPIGRVDVFAIEPYNGNAGVGIGIGDPADRGHGYGRDAVEALVDYLFGQLRLERIWLTTDADNLRAQHLYESVGFRREGLLRHAYYQDGRYQDDVRMAILREEWRALPRPKTGMRIDPLEPEPLGPPEGG
jgi:RimJ/RimL family protein N-acetyltransferase